MASTVLLVVVFVLDLIAFGLAIAAEQRRATVSSFCSFFHLLFFHIILYGVLLFCFGLVC